MSYATRVFDSRLRYRWAVRLTALPSALFLSGCFGGSVRLEPFEESLAPTAWESIQVFESADEIQRDFLPLGLLHTRPQGEPITRATINDLKRKAAGIGANAIVLEGLDVLGSDAVDGEPADGHSAADEGKWTGTATALRVLDPRWGDRYWRFGNDPEPLVTQSLDRMDAPTRGWTRLHEWKGLDARSTESFWIPSGEWRVIWEAAPLDGGRMEVLIYSLPNDVLTARIAQDGGGGGTYLGLAQGGEFYLQINGSEVEWEVAVDTWTSEQR